MSQHSPHNSIVSNTCCCNWYKSCCLIASNEYVDESASHNSSCTFNLNPEPTTPRTNVDIIARASGILL